MEKVKLAGKETERKSDTVKGAGDAGTILQFNHRITTYRLRHDREEEMFRLLAFLQTHKHQEVGKIEVHSTNQHYLIELTNQEDSVFNDFNSMKAAIYTDEFYLHYMTGVRLSNEDILFEYEIAVHEVPYEQSDLVPLGGVFL